MGRNADGFSEGWFQISGTIGVGIGQFFLGNQIPDGGLDLFSFQPEFLSEDALDPDRG
jgi:hypothetical protein